ncbi:MAG: hypothetical protein IKV94_05825 [Clostridia bacterium]|nr:hypothetical protein [Clostridia bacterium]
MDILNTLFSDRKTFIIMAIIYIIVVVFVLFLIWTPKSGEELATYEKVDLTKKNEEMAEYYFASIIDMGLYGSKSTFESIIDKNYLYYIGLETDELFENFRVNGVYPKITGTTIKNVGDTIVYSGIYSAGSGSVNVNIIERAPYDYTLTLDTFYDYSSFKRTGSNDGIVVTLSDEYNDFKYIRYNVEIENTSEQAIEIDLSKLADTYLTLGNSATVKLSSSSITSTIKLEKDDSIVTSLAFELDVSNQQDIDKLTFSNIKIGDSTTNVDVNIGY